LVVLLGVVDELSIPDHLIKVVLTPPRVAARKKRTLKKKFFTILPPTAAIAPYSGLFGSTNTPASLVRFEQGLGDATL
jgi:hypothetical protein